MPDEAKSHSDEHLHRILTNPWAYRLLQNSLGAQKFQRRFVKEHLRPFAGCRILDMGCGPADVLAHVPNSIGEYVGFDMNSEYIESARSRWKGRTECSFSSLTVEGPSALPTGHFDIVMAIGLVHHLADLSALRLFHLASNALKPNGVLVTIDAVHSANQHWFARWLISKDRGRAVRTAQGYRDLASHYFAEIEEAELHDMLYVPYTHFVMRCYKRD